MDITNANGQTIKLQPTEYLVQMSDSGLFTTSLIIAEAFDKNHYDVLKAISNLECSAEFNERNFAAVEYKDAKGELRPAFRITRDGFSFLAMGFTGKKAAAWKERFLAAFNAMEQALMQGQRMRQKSAIQEDDVPIHEQALERFKPRVKIKKDELEALMGLLRMQCYIQKITMDEAISQLSIRMGVFDVNEMSHYDYFYSVTCIVLDMFKIDTSYKGDEKAASEEIKEAVNGIMNLWVHESNFTKTDIKNYLFNHCNIYKFEDIKTKQDMLKALFVLWGGFTNYSANRRTL